MIPVNINGKDYQLDCDPKKRLLDVLRNDLGLTGPKEGCGEGECGACAVIADGKLINSCITAAGSVSGMKIMTIEGIRDSEKFTVLSDAFAEQGAVQCGYCTPGMIMAAEALLEKHPHPSEEDARRAISGNLCRCTGYNMIVRAVMTAAERGSGLW